MSSSAVSVTSGFLIACHVFENVALTIQIFVPVGARSSPQRRKLSQMKKEKGEEEKGKKIQNVVQQKANLSAHRAVFRIHGSANLAGLCLTGKAKFVV